MVTIRQIAQAVGVSSATVSRVLNFDQTLSVTPQKRQAIIETAEAMNYATPRARNRAGQALNKIALVHFLRPDQELIDPYYVGLRLGIESRCQALKLETIKVYHDEAMPEGSLLAAAAGVIAIGVHNTEEVDWLRRHNRHIVFADTTPPEDDLDSVRSDLPAAMHRLLEALTARGYRRIGFAGWMEETRPDPFGEMRCRAYIDWMEAHQGFDASICGTERSEGRNTERTGYNVGMRLLDQPRPPDAIVTCNDNIAVGVYRAAHELGLNIPDDVAVASFNDISAAQFLSPPLSTTHLPAEEIGQTAVDLLVERIAGRDVAKSVVLGTRIVWRGSTRQTPANATE